MAEQTYEKPEMAIELNNGQRLTFPLNADQDGKVLTVRQRPYAAGEQPRLGLTVEVVTAGDGDFSDLTIDGTGKSAGDQFEVTKVGVVPAGKAIKEVDYLPDLV
jgi:hypothetical protein